MATAAGLSLRAVLGHSHRQLLAWNAWLDRGWDEPDATQWYLMQVAAEVRRGRARHPGRVTVEDLRLRFARASASERIAPAAAETPAPPGAGPVGPAEAAWFARLGGRVRVVQPDGSLREERFGG